MEGNLKLKTINDILGIDLYIHDYQRGYRWIPQQVNDLLNDIWEFANKPVDRNLDKDFYCLQPIVVKDKVWQENGKVIDGYEVIDGQQRLTTIYIILKYLAKEYLKTDSLLEDYGKDFFSLCYATRDQSREFLIDIANRGRDIANDNIDFYYMSLAYNAVKAWFEESGMDRTDKTDFLGTLLGKDKNKKSTKIIWYQVDQGAESVDLFRRLNIGKIPLTNSELIKALFLNSSSFGEESDEEAIKKKIEISLIWDSMEQALAGEDFWSFCTNEKMEAYPTKIELLFDLIAKKPKGEIDPLYTFLYFANAISSGERTLWDYWLEIEQYFLTLQDWYRDRDLYHKVGYLITVGEQVIRGSKNKKTLIEYSMEEKKSKFNQRLDDLIRESLNFDITDLSYDKTTDHWKIRKVLLMFNIESVRKSAVTEFYPFKFHKKIDWSIEHIHAQNADLIDKNKKEQWETWLDNHRKTIDALIAEGQKEDKWLALRNKIHRFDIRAMTWETFSQLANEIMSDFSDASEDFRDDMHSIENLALLGQGDNSSLSNSVFEVKRRAILEMDREGRYIPLCTKRAFLKYYNQGHSTQQTYYWGLADRSSYLQEVLSVLEPYLPKGE